MKIKHFKNCPICQSLLQKDKANPLNSYGHLGMQKPCHNFNCINPLVKEPLHYYNHVVEDDAPNLIIYQEFSLDLGSRYVIFANEYNRDRSLVKFGDNVPNLEIPVLLTPDFPELENLVNKIKLSITFG